MRVAEINEDEGPTGHTPRKRAEHQAPSTKNTRFGFAARLAALIVLAAMITLSTVSSFAQNSQTKDDMEQLVMDLHVGMDRSTLTPQQKDQMRDDVKELRAAHKDHEMMKGVRAARSLRTMLDSGAFKPEDQQRIKQDIQQVREAREDKMGGGGM